VVTVAQQAECPTVTRDSASSNLAGHTQVVDNSYAKCIPLVCHHYASRETDDLYRQWRPKRNMHYCEKCDKWRYAIKLKQAKYPMDPLF
jgi:hypothetical protein